MACVSLKVKRTLNYALAFWVVMTLMICLRYGQGTDYFGYVYIFNSMRTLDGIRYIHGEPLFLLMCWLFNQIGSFELFAGVIALADMIMLWGFIRKYSRNVMMSLFLSFPVLYMTYFYSGLRQGIVIAVFLRFCTGFIIRGEWRKYLITCLVLALIHSVALIYLAVPLVMMLPLRVLVLSVPFMTLPGILLYYAGGLGIPYFGIWEPNFITCLERMLSFAVVMTIYYSQPAELHKGGVCLMKLYVFGTALYFLFMSSHLVSSRLAGCFKLLETIIVPSLIHHRTEYRQLCIIYFIMLPVMLYWNNVNGYIPQGRYRSDVNWINYPYVWVLNARDIYNYRAVDPRFLQ